MKQITQNLKKGTLTIEETPIPVCKSNGLIVKTLYSAISIGTEIMKINNADMNYLQMARAKPEQFKEVMNTLIQFGPTATYRKVMNKLDAFSSMGYSLSGEVIEVGSNVRRYKVGDMVACGGAGYANHAEINYIPEKLCAKVPVGVDMEQASMATIGAIAMQGFRQTQAQIGENIAVIGLGLLGQILVQIIQANGCRVIGFDIDQTKCDIASEQGAYYTVMPENPEIEEEILAITNGYGCDAIILTTSTLSNDPIILAGKIARDKARIVDIGITKMDLNWDLYYHKELDFRFSRSYGPGRYDQGYEEGNQDYPIGYVRWTEQRNMESILQLLYDKKLDFSKIITHSFDFTDAISFYKQLQKGGSKYLGVTLKYSRENENFCRTLHLKDYSESIKKVKMGCIGAGNYASTMLFPFLRKNPDCDLVGIATATGLNAKDKAVKLKFDYATTDYHELLSDQHVNSIMISTRHNKHAKMVVDSLKAGKNVYIEKPLALNLEELRLISNTYKTNPMVLFVGYNRRFSPSMKYVKSKINPSVPYSAYYQINAGFIPDTNWYQSPEQGGRIIGEACHFVDTLMFLFESRPVQVFASSTSVHDMPEQDNLFITLKFENGSTAIIAYHSDGNKYYPKEKLFLTGCRSNIEFNNYKSVIIYSGRKKKLKRFMSIDKGQKNEMEEWIKAVINSKNNIPIESLFYVSLVTIKAIESLQKNQILTISLNELL